MNNQAQDFPWVIFELQAQLYAINTCYIREMIEIPKYTALPDSSEEVRGVIDLRGEVAVLLDTRRRLGLASLEQESRELIELLQAREQDHVNWLETLETAIREQREFHLTTDPHQCAFGKWYDHFHTDNPVLKLQLQAFDEPHKALHALGKKLISMSENGQRDQALHELELAGNSTLGRLVALFDSAREILRESNREIVMVLEWRDQLVALSVDTVTAVEHLADESRQAAPDMMGENGGHCVKELGQRKDSDQLVQLLDLEELLLPLQDVSAPQLAT